MNNCKTIIYCVFGLFFILSSIAFGQEDRKGCNDHPLFNRMEGYDIFTCRTEDFGAHEFIDPATNEKVTIEGKKIYIGYSEKKEYRGKHSYIQVSRNYTNAIQKIGGTFWVVDPKWPYKTSMKLIKEGKEIWAWIHIDDEAEGIHLTVVEKQAMAQEIVADTKFMMAEGINTTGHVAIYGIYFNFNKADIKPESEPALKEITFLLQQEPNLIVYVVGHTDNVGSLDYNMKLSLQRAEAVVEELVSKYGISSDRLKSGGVGPMSPVASNDTEEGRAKNRRVELVKQ